MVRVCESNVNFSCVHCPSICSSRYLLLNQLAEFNQTCYITFPHSKDVREQHYYSVRPSVWRLSICPSCYFLLNHWAELNQTCYMTSPRGKGVGEEVHPSVMLLETLATSVGTCDGAPSIAHSTCHIKSHLLAPEKMNFRGKTEADYSC